jgi:hypothetical protein
MFARLLHLLAIWAVAGLLLCWGRLPVVWRRGLALVASAAGLVFLFLAFNTVGERETATTGAFLLGPQYVTGKTQASASLPYYVMTGVCLLLGTVGLAVPTAAARRLADHWMASAIGLSVLITVVRFVLEQAAAPAFWIWTAGITALPPVMGAFFAWSAGATPRSWRRLAVALLAYGLAVRAWVAALYIAATTLHLGSHYDLSEVARFTNFDGTVSVFTPASVGQVVKLAILPQLFFWPFYTLLAGLMGAVVFWLARRLFDLPSPASGAPGGEPGRALAG